MRTVSLQDLARVSGGANVIGPEGTANGIAIASAVSVATMHGTLGALLLAGAIPTGIFFGGLIATADVAYSAGSWLYENNETVRNVAGAGVGAAMEYGGAAWGGVVEIWGGGSNIGGGSKYRNVTVVMH